ncbi:unnamed protein product [Haemonchus placei]|uniref:ANF_receptor domain-containing protein n=1 Tax=Haemonchus placei TaxID=6290 RepID=A0A0N4VX24_HAEPC|nr:unnamed protein product [Haemonchus placei]
MPNHEPSPGGFFVNRDTISLSMAIAGEIVANMAVNTAPKYDVVFSRHENNAAISTVTSSQKQFIGLVVV